MTELDKKKPSNNEVPKRVKKKKKPHTYLWSRILAVFLITVVLVGLGGVGLIYKYASNTNPSQYGASVFASEQTSKILDASGNVIDDLAYKYRENVTYEDLPQSLIDAFVAIEDSRFFEHNGFDIPRFTKAAMENVVDSVKSGSVVFGQGGSTFTMQLVKNSIFVIDDPETGKVEEAASEGMNGIERKVKEIYIATYLESSGAVSKKDILSFYLNKIDFGSGNNQMGIQNSSVAYFGKDVSELNLVESAFLAGVINAPYANTPYSSIQNAQDRTYDVLYQMHNHGYITKAEFDLAASVPVENLLVENTSEEGNPYQAYIDAVLKEIPEFMNKFAKKEQKELNPWSTQMIIHTGMNQEVQAGLDRISNREIDYLDHGVDSNIQIATAVTQNNTGLLVGLLGGYDYYGKLIHNRATESPYMPGSTIKPLIDYAPAFEYLGYSTSYVLTDKPVNWLGSTGAPVTNFDGRYVGQITVMDAVQDSRNTTAIQTYQAVSNEIGQDGMVNYLQSLGLPVEFWDDQQAIGSNSLEVTMTQLSAAYATMYNGGEYIQPHTITKIELVETGEVLEANYEPVQVISDESAYLTTRLMDYTARSGGFTGVTARSGYEVFSKTGSVGWDSQGLQYGVPNYDTKDKLMVTGTSEFSIATWTGFDKYFEEGKDIKPWFSQYEYDLNVTGYTNSYVLDLLEEAYGTPANVVRPSGVVSITHILGTYPYQTPLADMNPDMITTGLIRSKYAQLTSAQPQELKSMSKQSVTYVQSGNSITADITMSEYPDANRLKVAESTLSPEEGGGRRLYDDSWIYGAVQYKSEVKVGSDVIASKVDGNNKQSITFNLVPGVKEYQICSYYTYDKSPAKSQAQCSTITAKEETYTLPDFTGNSYSEFRNWASSNNVTNIELEYVYGDLDKYNTIKSTTPASGSVLTKDQLQTQVFTVSIYDYIVNANYYKNPTELINSLGAYGVTFTNPNGGTVITSFTIDGRNVTTFNLSEQVGTTVIINSN